MSAWLWIAFILLILTMLLVDLGVFHRKSRIINAPEAATWTTVWVIMAMLFNVLLYYLYEQHVFGIGVTETKVTTGKQAALQFFTGYIIEKSLSLDNIFVIAIIFSYFRVHAQYQHRVLFWGIFGAIVMRGVMISVGTALIHRFTWITYVFGVLLLATSVKMLIARHDNLEPGKNPLVRLVRRFFPVSPDFDGPRFFTHINGQRAITPLFLVLIVVESSDLLFAVDSIPAIFSVTHDPFIVFTSNIFAILGLRSLYFLLASVMDKFRYLKMSLVFLLAYVGVKMLLTHHYPIPILVSLAIIGGILSVGVLASVIAGSRDSAALISPLSEELDDIADYSIRQLRRFVVIILGAIVLLIGIAMIILPGPSVLVIPAGLAILGTEFLWARQLTSRIKLTAKTFFRRIQDHDKKQ